MAANDADLIAEAKEQFKLCEDAWDENRKRWEEDVRFGRMGEQWPDEIKSEREAQGRPCLTVTRMPGFIRQVVNDSRQNKPGIRVHPVDSAGDPETADVLNGLIRNIEVSSDAEVAYDTAIDHAASGGVGYFRVDLDYAFADAFDLDIRINRIMDPMSVFGDPQSKAADSSDWDVAFVVNTLTLAEFKRKYPKAKETVDWVGGERGYDGWRTADTVRIAEYWKREEEEREIVLLSNGQVVEPEWLEASAEAGLRNADLLPVSGISIVRRRTATFHKVTQRLVTGAEVLKTVDWLGRYIPIIPVYGEEVVFEGRRQLYSLIHWGMDPQRIYNYGRSASVEAAALQPKAPYVGAKGQFNSDANRWATANTQNHAYLEYDVVEGVIGAPQRQSPPTPSAAWLQEAQVASDDIKSTIGMFDASMGQRSNETSGKAIVKRQMEGDVSTFHFIDNLSRAIRHAGRIIIDLIPKVYTRPRMVRVLGEDRKTSRMVQTGPKPMAGGGEAMQPPAPPVMAGAPPVGQPMSEPDPRAEAMDRIYDLAAGKYDVTVSAGPSFTTRREEAAMQMMELLRAFPQAAMLIGDLLATNLDWPGADEIAERLKAWMAQQQAGGKEKPGTDPAQKAMIDAQARVKAAEVTTAGRIEETRIKTAAQRQTDQERIVAEQQTAAQQQAVSAMAGQQPPQISPGGNIAR